MYSLKILQNSTRDLFHSSLLMFDKKIYMFNCSDGTQRNVADQNMKFNKISNIFYNDAHLDSYLGTFGFWMSRSEQITGQLIAHSNNLEKATEKTKKVIEEELDQLRNLKSMKLWGPPGFRKNFKDVDNFFFEGVNKYVNEYDFNKKVFKSFTNKEYNYFEDEHVKIYPICTTSSKNGDKTVLLKNKQRFKAKESSNYNSNDMIIEETHLDIDSDTSTFINENNRQYAMSYICEPHLKPPAFLVEKAKGLGLKPGPQYGELQKGKSVFLPDGTEIKPEDVLGKQAPSSCVGIFYSPSVAHAKTLTQNEIVISFQNKSENRLFALAIHVLKDFRILEEEFYQNFMKSFGEDTLHIIDCKETNYKFLLNEGKHKIKTILSKVNSSLFKNGLFTQEDTLPSRDLLSLKGFENFKNCKIKNSAPGFEYQLYPVDKLKILKHSINEEPFIYKNKSFAKFEDEVDTLIKDITNKFKEDPEFFFTGAKSFSPSDDNANESDKYCANYNLNTEPEITFLGTTSMKPGKYRNVSSILVTLSKMYNKNALLLDCGEGTFGQIYEHFGDKTTDELLLKLKVIFITHKHGDHMLGTLKIISEIDKLLIAQKGLSKQSMSSPSDENITSSDNIYIIAPSTVKKWIRKSINRDITFKERFILIDCADLNPNQCSVYKQFIDQQDHHPLENFHDVSIISDKENLLNKISTYHKNTSGNKQIENFFQFINKHLGINLYSIEVFHCNESYGCYLEESTLLIENKTIKKPWKISYSGDTRPCNNFWNYSMDSTVFVHEATFDDELGQDAKDKMHSTFNEALDIGLNNGSWKIALTHFSPRYIKATKWSEIFMKKKILLSHDFLSFKLSDLEWAYYYTKLFSKIIDLLESDKKYENLL